MQNIIIIIKLHFLWYVQHVLHVSITRITQRVFLYAEVFIRFYHLMRNYMAALPHLQIALFKSIPVRQTEFLQHHVII